MSVKRIINVDKDVLERVMSMKKRLGFKSASDTLKYLLRVHERQMDDALEFAQEQRELSFDSLVNSLRDKYPSLRSLDIERIIGEATKLGGDENGDVKSEETEERYGRLR